LGDDIRLYDFRPMAQTILRNVLKFQSDCIALQFGHSVGGTETEHIYTGNPQYLPERKAMMQAWADWLDGLYDDGNAVALVA